MKKLTLLTLSLFYLFKIQAQDKFNEYGIKVYPIDKKSVDPSSMSYLDSIVVDYNHFFLSEYHGFTMDLNLKKKFVKYLAEKRQLNKIIMEEPYSYGYWVNKYLQSGDTTLLRTFLDNYYSFGRYGKNKPEQMPDYYDFFTFVYKMNRKNGLNIEVVGVDLSTSVLKPEFWTLKKVFEDFDLDNVYPESYENLEKLNKRKKVRKGKAERWLNDFDKETLATNADLPDLLKREQLRHFNRMIRNLELMIPKFATRNRVSKNYRDSLMYHRYTEFVQPSDIAFSQMGWVHTILSDSATPDRPGGIGIKPFATRVKNDPNFKNKCLSINLHIGWEGNPHNNLFTKEENKYLRSSNNYEEVMLDFRNATAPYDYVSQFQQLTILINYFPGYFRDED